MPTSLIGIDEPAAADKNLRTWSRSVSATTVESQFTLPEEHVIVSQSAVAAGISTATSLDHLIVVEADGTLYTRIRRIWVQQVVAATSATLARLQLVRTTTASTGGTTVTGRPYDGGDADYAGRIATLPTAKGTEDDILVHGRLWLTNSIAANPNTWEWEARPDMKPIILAPAVTNGLALKIVTGIAAGQVDILVEFTTSAYL